VEENVSVVGNGKRVSINSELHADTNRNIQSHPVMLQAYYDNYLTVRVIRPTCTSTAAAY